MSSASVRAAINAAVTTAAAPLPVFDISDYVSLDDCLGNIDSQCVLIQYVAAGEEIVTVGGPGNQGYEETGTVVLHLMVPTGFESDTTVATSDTIREALRGQRVAPDVVLEQVDPFVDFGLGSGLYGGAWHGWASNVFYSRRDCG